MMTIGETVALFFLAGNALVIVLALVGLPEAVVRWILIVVYGPFVAYLPFLPVVVYFDRRRVRKMLGQSRERENRNRAARRLRRHINQTGGYQRLSQVDPQTGNA